MSIVAIIPARGNSKRLPGKNLKLFNGVPLVVRAIRCAKEAGIFSQIIVSSGHDDILALAWEEGVEGHYRHSYLSDDGVQTAAPVFDVLTHDCMTIPDAFCVLNPTSPLRTPELLRDAYESFTRHNSNCLASGRLNGHDGDFLFWKTLPFLRYISRSCIPPDADWMLGSGVDINTEEDFQRALTAYEIYNRPVSGRS